MSPPEVKSYEKQRLGINKALKDVAASSKSKAAKRAVNASKQSHEFKEVAMTLFHESMDLYEDGEMDWEEVVDDLSKALKAIDMMKNGKEEED